MDLHLTDRLWVLLPGGKKAGLLAQVQIAALLAEHGPDVDVQDGRGNTPLMLAARCGHGNADVSASVVRTLMESDTAVGLEVTNNDGQTALTWAVVNGHIKLVRLLMQQGSDPMTIDNDGRGILAVTAGTGQHLTER